MIESARLISADFRCLKNPSRIHGVDETEERVVGRGENIWSGVASLTARTAFEGKSRNRRTSRRRQEKGKLRTNLGLAF
jgi:hypothetical protein